ncbi:MAG: lysostaphin resistance A-like protein [Sporolactobacillus sp.]
MKKWGASLFKRYTAIIILYLLCLFSPYLPGFRNLMHLFPDSKSGFGMAYTIIFLTTLILTLLLLLPDRRMVRSSRASLASSAAWAIFGIFALFALQSIVGVINTFLLGQPMQSTHTTDVVDLTRYSPIFIFTASIIGPILEEVVFRKIFFGSLRQRMPFILAASISSLVFALFHQDLPHLLVYFVIGLFLCFVYDRTKRIGVTMFMHAGMNAIVLIANLSLAHVQLLSLLH